MSGHPTPVAVLRLPLRVVRALAIRGIGSVPHLASLTDDDLLRIRNIGEKSLRAIRRELKYFPVTEPHSERLVREEVVFCDVCGNNPRVRRDGNGYLVVQCPTCDQKISTLERRVRRLRAALEKRPSVRMLRARGWRVSRR